MRVLLLHEMSGVHTELRLALRRLGIDADIATFGDNHKKFATDIGLGANEPGARGAASRALRQLSLVPSLRGYDIIQSISPQPFNRAVTRLMEPMVFGRGGPRFVYLSAGSDTFYRKHIQELDYCAPHEWHENAAVERQERRLLRRASALVGGAWEYHWALGRAGYRSRYIPFPINLDKVTPLEVGTGPRITVYHPLNRLEGNDFKGTSHIRAAFAMLRDEFAGVADFVERGGMPFSEYIEFTRSVDILVDQATAYSYGMSATYGLAQGQVVLSGNHPKTHALPSYAQSPVVAIRPDAHQIADTLRGLVTDRARIRELGRAGRAYAERHHDAMAVAEQYADVYARVLRG